MSNIFTPKEFISTKAQLELDVKNVKTFKNKQVTIHYIPVRCNDRPLNIECQNQILASNAKVPSKTDDIKFLNVSFRSMDKNTISEIPYNNSDKLAKANQEFIKMLDEIDDQYKALVEDLKIPDIKMPNNPTIGSIRQDKTKDVDLEQPIYRVRLPVTSDGLVGTNYDQYKPIVTNTKSKKLMSLTINEAKQFITYQSLASFILHIECVVVSKTGMSLRVTIKKMNVLHKKPVVIELESNVDEFANDSDGSYDRNVKKTATTKSTPRKTKAEPASKSKSRSRVVRSSDEDSDGSDSE